MPYSLHMDSQARAPPVNKIEPGATLSTRGRTFSIEGGPNRFSSEVFCGSEPFWVKNYLYTLLGKNSDTALLETKTDLHASTRKSNCSHGRPTPPHSYTFQQQRCGILQTVWREAQPGIRKHLKTPLHRHSIRQQPRIRVAHTIHGRRQLLSHCQCTFPPSPGLHRKHSAPLHTDTSLHTASIPSSSRYLLPTA